MRLRLILLSVVTVALCFILYMTRPYAVLSDSGYQALSAKQYLTHHVSKLNYLSVVNPHDLTKNVECSLTDWTPFGAYMFFVAFKLGLPPGTAGRLIAFLASAAGAIGWVWITSLIGLRGAWRVAGVILAATYCLRFGLAASMGTQDYLIYAVAPWLMVAAIELNVRSKDSIRMRTVFQTAILCLALGAVYCLKYTGIFMSLAVFCFLCVGQLWGLAQKRRLLPLSLLLLYGGAFVLPILGQKAYNYRRTGSDFIESVVSHHRQKTPELIRQYFAETAFNASTVLFNTRDGANRLARDREEGALAWLLRLPGLLVVLMCLFSLRWLGWTPTGVLTTLLTALPLFGFPVLSSLTGVRYVASFLHACAPFWIFLELMVLVFLSIDLKGLRPGFQKFRTGMVILMAFNFLLFLWLPKEVIQQVWQTARAPKYLASHNSLLVTDLSRRGTRDIDEQIRGLTHSSQDIIVPAVYSNRGFGSDVWIEMDEFGRLLPMSYSTVALGRTQGDGANFYGSSPFESSGPVRIILVATDPYHRGDFQASVQRIRSRFTQAQEWTMVPVEPPDDRPHIWTTGIRP